MPRGVEARLTEVERRLDRLERLAFLGFQDVRDVAEYAYQSVLVEPDDVKRLSWKRRDFHALSDREAMEVAGLAVHELAALKMTMRTLRHQTRRDVLGVLRDLVRRRKPEATNLEKAA